LSISLGKKNIKNKVLANIVAAKFNTQWLFALPFAELLLITLS